MVLSMPSWRDKNSLSARHTWNKIVLHSCRKRENNQAHPASQVYCPVVDDTAKDWKDDQEGELREDDGHIIGGNTVQSENTVSLKNKPLQGNCKGKRHTHTHTNIYTPYQK